MPSPIDEARPIACRRYKKFGRCPIDCSSAATAPMIVTTTRSSRCEWIARSASSLFIVYSPTHQTYPTYPTYPTHPTPPDLLDLPDLPDLSDPPAFSSRLGR